MTRLALAAALVGVLASAGVAHADKADQQFKKAKKLLAEKRYAEACAAFQEVDRLAPELGAKVNVARCFEQWGKLASALRWYRDAEHLARETGDPRAKKIGTLIAELEPNVPKLTIKAPADADLTGVAITLDGKPLELSALDNAQPVDPGPHQISYTAAGRAQDKVVPIERGGVAEVTLELPAAEHPHAKPASKDNGSGDDEDSAPRKHHVDDEVASSDGGGHPGRVQRIIGLSASGAGLVALGIAGVVTLHARTDYRHAISAHCRGDKDMCDDVGLSEATNAHHRANIATAVSIGGAAAVVGGLVVFFIAPHSAAREEHALYLTPDVGADHGSLVFGGAF